VKALAEAAIDAALGSGASYADARAVSLRRQHVITKNGQVDSIPGSLSFDPLKPGLSVQGGGDAALFVDELGPSRTTTPSLEFTIPIHTASTRGCS
jgi:hypothetical protein